MVATPEAIEEAADLLRAGELVGFPTETVYGLGADAANAGAVARIFAAKGRPSDHPVIVHLGSAAQIDDWARAVPPAARRLARHFWPGPLTMILPRGAGVPDAVTGGQPGVGLRVPAHPVAQRLLGAFGGGVAAPSANRFGRVSPTTALHVASELGNAVSLILDGGACDVGIESTIVDFTSAGGRAVLLRPGGVDAAALADALGYPPLPPAGDAPRASGTLAAHYAPTTPTLLVPAADIEPAIAQATAAGRTIGMLAVAPGAPVPGLRLWLAGGEDPSVYAHFLYRHLRTLDAARVDLILIEQPPESPAWMAVNDRLQRATHRDEEMLP